MKIRNGFVSNSSSSSYICRICGEVEAGYELSFSDTNMIQCTNDHIICKHHILEGKNREEIKQILEKMDISVDNVDELLNKNSFYMIYNKFDNHYELPEEFCPICNMSVIDDKTLLNYMYKRSNTSNETIISEIRQSFNKLSDLENDNKLLVHFRKIKLNKLE